VFTPTTIAAGVLPDGVDTVTHGDDVAGVAVRATELPKLEAMTVWRGGWAPFCW